MVTKCFCTMHIVYNHSRCWYSSSNHVSQQCPTIFTSCYVYRMLSSWEPFLDPWRCNISWAHEGFQHAKGVWNVKAEASDRSVAMVTTEYLRHCVVLFGRTPWQHMTKPVAVSHENRTHPPTCCKKCVAISNNWLQSQNYSRKVKVVGDAAAG